MPADLEKIDLVRIYVLYGTGFFLKNVLNAASPVGLVRTSGTGYLKISLTYTFIFLVLRFTAENHSEHLRKTVKSKFSLLTINFLLADFFFLFLRLLGWLYFAGTMHSLYSAVKI